MCGDVEVNQQVFIYSLRLCGRAFVKLHCKTVYSDFDPDDFLWLKLLFHQVVLF